VDGFPCSTAIEDFNGDGKLDIAVTSLNSMGVSILLNTTTPGATTPTFSTRTYCAAGDEPCSIAIGDFNGDGKLDLVTANNGSNTVSVLLNTTTPGATISTFSTKTDFMTGSFPVSVAIGDFNGDGKLDLVTANNGSNTVSVFLNNTDFPLPVELVLLAARATGSNAELRWNTATEVNNYGFEIERRTVGSDQWMKIGFVKGAGTSNSPKEYSYTDTKLVAGRYVYRLKQVDNDGTFSYSQSVEVEVGGVPNEFSLFQNYPNPFNPSTVIQFDLPDRGQQHAVSLQIFDLLGREVATLLNEKMQAGPHQVTWNASNMPSGVYLYRLQAGTFTETKKLTLLK
jgi:uncharacterized protein (DUF2141 family)